MDSTAYRYPNRVPLQPVHPGRTLAFELEARGISAHALALKRRVPGNRITDIVRGRRSISAETALRLGRYFGTGLAFWLSRQSRYDLAVATRDLGAQIEREVEVAEQV